MGNPHQHPQGQPPRRAHLAPTPFALISFRHRGGEAATVALGEAINASGHSYVTPSQLEGVTFIRVSIGQTHTVKTHVERLWRLVDAAAAPLT